MAGRGVTGVFGGTFDPVHFGHLRPALEVAEQLGLDEVRMVPCSLPPHRGEPVATPGQRLAMLEMAVSGESRLMIDRRELEREGPSYMVDTLASMRADGLAPLLLILGADAFLGLPNWYHWQELFTHAHIVVTHRPGWSLERAGTAGADTAPISPLLQQAIAQRRIDDVECLWSEPSGSIYFMEVSQLDISATGIRQRIAAGGSARYLTPEPVWEWIVQNRLYR